MSEPAPSLRLFAVAITGVLKDGTRPFLVGAELAVDKKAAARSSLIELTKYRPQYTGKWQEGPNVTVRQVPDTMLQEAHAELVRRKDDVNNLVEVEVLAVDPSELDAVPVVVPDSAD